MKKVQHTLLITIIAASVISAPQTQDLIFGVDKPPAKPTETKRSQQLYQVHEDCILKEPFGLQVGDKILAVNDIPFRSPYQNLQDMREELRSKGNLIVEFQRDGKKMSVTRSQQQLEQLQINL